MKKFIMILLALTMVVSMVACGNNNNTTDPTEPTKPSITNPTEPTKPSQGGDVTEPTTPSQGGDVTEPTTPDVTEPTEPTERPKAERKTVTIEEYMTQKYGEYEFVRSEPWFEMYRIKNGTVSVFVFKYEDVQYGINLEKVSDYMFTYNWADNGYWQVNADKIEAYYDNLMKPYLKDVGEYALFAYLEQAVMPSELTLDMSWEDALKEYGEFLFPQITIMVKNPLTEEQKAAIVDKLTADGVKVRLHIGTAPAEDFELHRNSVIPYIVEKYSNQMDVRINWNGDMPAEEVPAN